MQSSGTLHPGYEREDAKPSTNQTSAIVQSKPHIHISHIFLPLCCQIFALARGGSGSQRSGLLSWRLFSLPLHTSGGCLGFKK